MAVFMIVAVGCITIFLLQRNVRKKIFWFFVNAIRRLLCLEYHTPHRFIPDGKETDRVLQYEESVELYHNGLSMCSQQVRLCLEALQIEYKSHHIQLIETGFYENIHPKYSNINPACVVPMLVHDGAPIHEAVDIIRYLEGHVGELPHRRKITDGVNMSLSINKNKYPILYKEMNEMIECTKLLSDQVVPQNCVKTIGCCIPFISIVAFSSMIVDKEISYLSILYGFIFHFDLQRPFLFFVLKLFGKYMFKIPIFKDIMNYYRGKPRYYTKRHLKRLNDILNKNNKYGPYICGKQFSLADIAWIPIFERLYGSGSDDLLLGINDLKDNDNTNLLHEYWENIKKQDCYKKAIYDWKMDENKCCIIGRSEKRLMEWIKTDKTFCKNIRL